MEHAQLARAEPSLPTATSTDPGRRSATKDSPLAVAVEVVTIVPRRQLPPSQEAAVDVCPPAECPSLPSACFADPAAGPSCPARSALSTCRSCSSVGAASVSRQVQRTRAFPVHRAKRQHPCGRSPARCSAAPLHRPFPRWLDCWGCDSPRSRLISLARHDTRSAGPSCPELRLAR